MRRLVRSAESIHALLLLVTLIAPLVLFFAKVSPWQRSFVEFFAQKSMQSALLNSLFLMVFVALFSTGFAFVFLWMLWRFDFPGRFARGLALLLKIPYLLPPFFIAMGWIGLAAPSVGYLNQLLVAIGLPQLPSIYGIGGTLFVEVMWTTALAMIQLQGFFSQYPGHLEDAAILCGASPRRTFFRITLPLARPQLIACMLLTSVSALSAFGVPALLASPARDFVLTTRIYQSIKGAFDFSEAGLLSLALLLVTLTLVLVQRFVLKRGIVAALVSGKSTRPARLQPGKGAWALAALASAFTLTGFVLPFAAIALRSLLRDPSDLGSWTLERYAYVFGEIPEGLSALINSLITASGAAAVATVLGLVLAYGAARLRYRPSRVVIETWNFGYALPGTIIALALLIFFQGTLADTLWILAVAYLVKYAAFALRTLTPAMGAIGKELEEAAWMSGASPLKAFFRILTPMLRPAIAASVVLSFVPMLSELTMSVLLAGAGTETLGTLIYRFQEYADPGSAAVLAVTVALATFLLNVLLKKMSKGSFGI